MAAGGSRRSRRRLRAASAQSLLGGCSARLLLFLIEHELVALAKVIQDLHHHGEGVAVGRLHDAVARAHVALALDYGRGQLAVVPDKGLRRCNRSLQVGHRLLVRAALTLLGLALASLACRTLLAALLVVRSSFSHLRVLTRRRALLYRRALPLPPRRRPQPRQLQRATQGAAGIQSAERARAPRPSSPPRSQQAPRVSAPSFSSSPSSPCPRPHRPRPPFHHGPHLWHTGVVDVRNGAGIALALEEFEELFTVEECNWCDRLLTAPLDVFGRWPGALLKQRPDAVYCVEVFGATTLPIGGRRRAEETRAPKDDVVTIACDRLLFDREVAQERQRVGEGAHMCDVKCPVFRRAPPFRAVPCVAPVATKLMRRQGAGRGRRFIVLQVYCND